MKRSNPQHTHIMPPLYHRHTHSVSAIHHSVHPPPSCQPAPDVRAQREPSHIQSVSHFLPRVKVKHHLCVCLRAFPIARAITLYLAAGLPGSLADGFASWRTAKGCRGRKAFSLPASHLFSPHKRQNLQVWWDSSTCLLMEIIFLFYFISCHQMWSFLILVQ